ncbi:hypothetical protein B0T10DRAFT_541861 [Thelonectria olida]|uniref:Zn(2)-C6 fungal-type domain-containing protein n=1 Tax=Thelonectria olida TaxID=1576542 RepID=A0A9P9ADX8_9HYPO|nr:hypothetical protein B0T10DRAFT_541861 [Thelonectria olida]
MDRRSKQKACFGCVDAKRRCDKILPFCSRCIDRGVSCVYPMPAPARRRQRLALGGAGMAAAPDLRLGDTWTASSLHVGDPIQEDVLYHAFSREMEDTSHSALVDSASSADLVGTLSTPSFASWVVSSCATGGVPLNGQLSSVSSDLRWFLQPSAWTVAYHYQPPASFPLGIVFSNFIRGLQSWLSRFLRAGHNPFIHSHLYTESGMPQCMRDAYSAIAVSQHVTTGNEHIVDDVSAAHVSNLLACQPDDGPLSVSRLTTREHLARTQALLIHLLLALFSPSIPRRAKAESLVETLIHWKNQLWESAARDVPAAQLCPNVLLLTDGESDFTPDSVSALHKTFILSESVRRTWILCSVSLGVYHGHKGDWSYSCAGDICMTARAELWSATSSARWEAAARSQDPLFLYSLHGRSLVERGVGASEVDEFARHLFTVMWGLDQVEDWVVRTGDGIQIMY